MTATKMAEEGYALAARKMKGMGALLGVFNVTDEATLAEASDHIKRVKTMKKFVEQEKKKLTDPANAILAEARSKYDPFIKECSNAEAVLKQKAGAFMARRAAKIEESKERIASKVEAGTMKVETAMRKMDEMPDDARAVATDGGSGLRMQRRRQATIVDPSLVPDEYWVIDEVRVRKAALAGAVIPGVEVAEVEVIASV